MGLQVCRLVVFAALPLCLVACGGSQSLPAPSPLPQPPPQPSPAQSVQLSGTVRDYSGQPQTGADVTVTYDLPGRDPLTAKTDEAGHYEFSVITGALSVRAEREGLYADSRRLTVSANRNQDLELMPGITISAGGSAEADLHAGPHNSPCSVFSGSFLDEADSCREVTVVVERPGTLEASLQWPATTGLALTQRVLRFDLPMYGPSVCCEPGLVLKIPVAAPARIILLVRLRTPSIAPVRFTLHTSEGP